jgi:hypothetical protein
LYLYTIPLLASSIGVGHSILGEYQVVSSKTLEKQEIRGKKQDRNAFPLRLGAFASKKKERAER